MLAEMIMVTEPVCANVDDSVEDTMSRMRAAGLRMLPVLDATGVVVGVISSFSIMENIVPNYIVSGDLDQISYAPDMGILRRQYNAIAPKKIFEVMEKKPLLVGRSESLLSVAAAMISFGKHEYALVVDRQQKLLGIISAGDILDRLKVMKLSEGNDA